MTENTLQTMSYLLSARVGCAALVVQVTGSRWPRPAYSILLTGLARVALEGVVQVAGQQGWETNLCYCRHSS